jgi:hypothetical protein
MLVWRGMKDLALKPHPNPLARHSPPRQSSSLNNCFVWHAETFGPRLRSNARVASQRQSIFVLFPLGYLWRGSEAGSRHSKVKIRTAIPRDCRFASTIAGGSVWF